MRNARASDTDDDPVLKACPAAVEFYQKREMLEKQREAERKPVVLPKLREQLLAWVKPDQDVRNEMVSAAASDPAKFKRLASRMRAVDESSYRRIKGVIDEYGFPTDTMVGRDGAGAAFLLVQHQDAHPEFQQFVLDIMTSWVRRDEVDRESFALLTDRVLVAQKKPQRYGSQFRGTNGGAMEMQPVEDPEHLDQRRAEVGLPPMAVYRCIMGQMYRAAVK
ncbi:MAG: hypothetical protein QM741_05000 [Rudaea sp.]|uniref:DUF6624 domain-containing protein n=1 Tax=Rudaea sp. TaxID=2136325 RepID=UPI0039E39E11